MLCLLLFFLSSFIHWKKKKNKKKRKKSYYYIYTKIYKNKKELVLLRLSFSFISCLRNSSSGVFFLIVTTEVAEDFVLIFTICIEKKSLFIRLFAVYSHLISCRGFREIHNSCSCDWQKAGQVFVTNFSCLSLVSFSRCYLELC